MSSKFRFYSGTNRYAFEDWLVTQGLAFSTMGDVITVRSQDGEAYDEALSLGASVISSDFDEAGAGDAWVEGLQVTANRASPPDVLRGPPPLTYGLNQIVSQPGYEPEKPPGAFPARRKTRGQP